MKKTSFNVAVRAAAKTLRIDPDRVLVVATAPPGSRPRVTVYLLGALAWTTARKLAKAVQAFANVPAEVSFENASWRDEKGYVRCIVPGEPFNFPHFGGPGERRAT